MGVAITERVVCMHARLELAHTRFWPRTSLDYLLWIKIQEIHERKVLSTVDLSVTES